MEVLSSREREGRNGTNCHESLHSFDLFPLMTALEEFRDRSTILGRIEDVPRGASEGQVSGGFLGGEVGGERGKEGERKVSFLRRLEIR